MAAGLRNIKIKFTGDAKDLQRAARAATKAVSGVGKGILGAIGSLGAGIGGALTDALGALPPMGKLVSGALVAGLGTYLAPAVGAALSTAVLLGLGGGILAAGIKLAASSPQVTAAGGELKKRFMDIDTTDLEKAYQAAQERMTSASGGEAKKRAAAELAAAKKALDDATAYNKKNFSLKDAAKAFEEPLVGALKTFQAAADKAIPKIEGWFKKLAPVIEPLAEGLVKLGAEAFPGVDRAVTAAVPLFETLAAKLPEIGAAIGRFFDKIASSGPQTNTFFSDFLDLIIGVIDALGTVIGWLASFYTAFRDQITALKVLWIQFKISAIEQFAQILDAAYDSLSWIPGLDSKLAAAKEKFAQFRSDANAELAMIKSQYTVTITAHFKAMGFKSPSPGQFTGRASGGPVRAGGTYMVGERGPEVVTFGSNGTVTPNRELQGETTYEIHVQLSDDVTRVITLRDRDLKRRVRGRRAVIA